MIRCALLSLLLIPLIIQAAPHHRYYRTHKHPHKITAPANTVNKVGWKEIAASGVAGGTVIAAYKISDGIQEGTKCVAKEHPDKFNSWASALAMPLRWILWIASGIVMLWLFPRLIVFLQKIKPKKGQINEN